MKRQFAVSVIVVATDDLPALVPCVEALAEHTVDDGSWELVILDNASSDDTAGFLALLEGDVLIKSLETLVPHGAAVNAGFGEATGHVVVLVDPHVRVGPGWLEALLVTLDADPGLGAVALMAASPDGSVADAGLDRVDDGAQLGFGARRVAPRRDGPIPVQPCAAVSANAVAIRRDAVSDMDGVDGGQDRGPWLGADLSRRLGASGWRLVLIEVPGVTFSGDPTLGDGGRRYRTQWRTDPGSAPPAAAPRAKSVALYLPQFHPIPQNDQWWGPGFTEWRNVVAGRPRFEGHAQPHLPADLGFYDLRVPETRAAQADLARSHGVDAFCYYHYWFAGQRLLGRPIDDILDSGEPDFDFMLCWANEDWRRNWDGRTGEVLKAQDYSVADDVAHMKWLVPVLGDARYLRVDGRPIFTVYRADLLPDPAATTRRWREIARAEGLGELMLCRVESFGQDRGDPRPLGFDASIEFQPDWLERENIRTVVETEAGDMVHDYRDVVQHMLNKADVPWRRYPCVAPGWDNTARRAREAVILHGSTPQLYEEWVAGAVERELERARMHGDEPVVFVNAWNEWAEGAHLEPCEQWGTDYLEAHARGIGARDHARIESRSQRRIALNASEVDEIAERADDLVATDPERALRLTQAAADQAWYVHTGRFAIPRLERLAARLGATAPASPERPASTRVRRVLHVLSEAHQTGGHTRLAWRWMERDHARHHEVALVNQGEIRVPEPLIRAAQAVHDISATTPHLIGRVTKLRQLARRFDLVVMHTHPYDAVSVAALTATDGPPVLFTNHAGHVFWLGSEVADAIVCVRPVELELAANRRGIGRDRLVLLPSPIDFEERVHSRDEARRVLGLHRDAIVAVTVASAYKYESPTGDGFIPLVAPLVEHDPRVVLLAVGPSPSGDWNALAAATDGRGGAVGRQEDLRPYFEAADLYLDSYPLTSPTSILEAVSYGMPAVSFRPDGYDVLGADDAAFDDAMLMPETPAAFRSAVRSLIDDPLERVRRGERLAEGVRTTHSGSAWNAALEAAYERAVENASARSVRSEDGIGRVSDLDERLLALHEAGGQIRPRCQILAAHGVGPGGAPSSSAQPADLRSIQVLNAATSA